MYRRVRARVNLAQFYGWTDDALKHEIWIVLIQSCKCYKPIDCSCWQFRCPYDIHELKGWTGKFTWSKIRNDYKNQLNQSPCVHRPRNLSQKLGEIVSFKYITSCEYFRWWWVHHLVSCSTALLSSSLGNCVIMVVLKLACQFCRQ